MTLPAQLRAIADRLEAAEVEKAAALDELWQIRTAHDASAQGAVEDQPGEALPPPRPPSAPIQQAKSGSGREGLVPLVARQNPAPSDTSAFDPLGPAAAHTQQGVAGASAVAKGRAGGLYPCPHCERVLPLPQNVGRHVQTAHANGSAPAPTSVMRKGKETFLCSRCPLRFESREKLESHLLVAHPDNEPRRLPVGRRAFSDPVDAVLHRTGGGGSQ